MLNDVKNLEFRAGTGEFAYAQLGHGGAISSVSGFVLGDIFIGEVDDMDFIAGKAAKQPGGCYAQLGHGGLLSSSLLFSVNISLQQSAPQGT